MNGMLREATLRDIEAMYEVSCSAHLDDVYRKMIPSDQYEKFRHNYMPNATRQSQFVQKIFDRINHPKSRAWVVVDGTDVIGYTLAGWQDNTWRLQGLFVLPEHQGKGVGKRLFRKSCEAAMSGSVIELTVLTANARAIQLYEAEGFRISRRDDHLFYGAAQTIMRRTQ